MDGIERIKKIHNLGIFSDFSWPTEPSGLKFDRINLLYGYNGSGKTTLSNVIGLFSYELEELEQKRIAQDMASDPMKDVEIEIECESKVAKFPKDRQKLYVFNSAFVAEHVYDGRQAKVKSFKSGVLTKEQFSNQALKTIASDIDAENKRKGIIEGYQEALVALGLDIKNALSKTWNENISSNRMPQGLDLINCPDQVPDESEEDLQKALEEQFSKFKISKDQETLEKDIVFLKQILGFDSEFPDTLKETIQKSISKAAREKVQQKIETYKDRALKHTSTQNWFEDGSSLLKHNKDKSTCPLCDSALLNIGELIESYDAFFNDELAALKMEIAVIIRSIDSALEETQRNQLDLARLQTILVRYGYQDIPSDAEKEAFERLHLQTMEKLLQAGKELFKTKRDAIDFTPSEKDLNKIVEMLSIFRQLKMDAATLLSFKEFVLEKLTNSRFDAQTARAICAKLFWKRFDLQAEEKANRWRKEDGLREEGQRLVIGEHTGGIALYRFLNNLLQKTKQVIAEKEEQKTAELSNLKKESEYVNAFLARLCVTNFTINKDDEGKLTIYYTGVSPRKGIQYSLSEGEKTTLAFAYFLSKYQYEVIDNESENQEDYMIVVDDPVSSLDENRLLSTALVIQDFLLPKAKSTGEDGNKVMSWSGTKQAFVFSHNIIFLKFMSNIINSDQNKGKADFYLGKGNISSLPNVLKNYQTSYFYKLDKIKAFVNDDIDYESAKDYLPNYIRVTLEAFISFKFARLRGRDKHKPAMLDDLIKKLDGYSFTSFAPAGEVVCKDTLKLVLHQIKNKVNPENHGTVQDITHIEYLPESELKIIAEQTLNVIQFLDQIHFEAAEKLQKLTT
ncbi:AAA family ATPase [Nitrospira sp. M1]